jgi:hypothetical protein
MSDGLQVEGNPNVNEKSIRDIIAAVLAQIGRDDCNAPVIDRGFDDETLDGSTRRLIKWAISFSCPKSAQAGIDRVKFEVQSPPEKSEKQLEDEIRTILINELGKKT